MQEVDYLTEDKPVPKQKFVVLSILSPKFIKTSNEFDNIRGIKIKETNNTLFSCAMYDDFININYNFQIDNYLSSHSRNSSINQETDMKISDIRPYGKWFKNTFKNNEKNICISWNSIFGVSKKNILQKPKSFYENLIKQVNDHQNPETVHFFERSWYAIFYPYDDDISFIS
jgi:hypothetical protein